jgi:hypothetical protein
MNKFIPSLSTQFILNPIGQTIPNYPQIYPPSLNEQILDSTHRFVPRFDKPVDGLPVMEDWITTFESMFFAGIELNREPLDCTMSVNAGQYL